MSSRPFAQQILYPTPTLTSHYGRNGNMQGHGISIEAWGGEAHICPVVSRERRSGSARISVPFDQLNHVITALIAVRDGTS